MERDYCREGDSMNDKILCVDDEPNILIAYRRQLRKKVSHVDTALGGEEGLKTIRAKGPYAVVISDLKMPGLSGIEFLSQVGEHYPDTVKVMITGFGDLDSAMTAVNHGNVFRFLTKPVDTDKFIKTVQDAVRQYELVIAEKELLEETLKGSVHVMTEVLSQVNPIAFSRAMRLKKYCRQVAEKLKVDDRWKLEIAAMLSQIGCITLHPSTLEKIYADQKLEKEEEQAYSGHPEVGAKLLEAIPRLEEVTGIIRHQLEPEERGGGSLDSGINFVSLGSQILNVVLEFDNLTMHGNTPERAAKKLRAGKDLYNGEIVEALEGMVCQIPEMERRSVRVNEMDIGMVFDQDVKNTGGLLLVARGQEVSFSILERLKKFSYRKELDEPVRVLVPHNESKEKEPVAS
ncbi:MAG: response regulator [Candidatus Latescibacteria bacterium]|nr:response regulator [bacterium]MBD3425511.1 response regulator [Candidatus Latescibacterota bacterium]